MRRLDLRHIFRFTNRTFSGLAVTATLLALAGCSDGCRTWAEGPLLGGRLSAIVAHPTDENMLLVGSPGNGVWRTLDNGINWKDVTETIDDPNVYHLEWDVTDPDRLFVVTASSLWVGSDVWQDEPQWVRLTGVEGLAPLRVNTHHHADPYAFEQLLFDDGTALVLWARGDGLYYSFDGVTLQHAWLDELDPGAAFNHVLAIAAEQDTGYVWLSTRPETEQSKAEVWRSQQQWTPGVPSLQWNDESSGLTGPKRVDSIEWVGPETLVAGVETEDNIVMYRRLPDQTSWKYTNHGTPDLGDPRKLLWAGNGWVFWSVARDPMATSDLGETWRQLAISAPLPNSRTLFAHMDTRAMHTRIYESPPRGYLWSVTDGYASLHSEVQANIVRWSWNGSGFPTYPQEIPVRELDVWQARSLGVVPHANEARILAGSQDNGMTCSDSRGNFPDMRRRWSHIHTATDEISIAVAPSDPDTVYVLNHSGLDRIDNAVEADTCADIVRDPEITAPDQVKATPHFWTSQALAVHADDSETLYAAIGLTLKISRDGGVTWAEDLGDPEPARPVCVRVHPETAALLVGTVTGDIWFSDDDGLTWQEIGPDLDDDIVVFDVNWIPPSSSTDELIAITVAGVFHRSAGMWQAVDTGRPEVASALEIDPETGDVYLGFGYVGRLGQQPGALLVSDHPGPPWVILLGDTPPIADLDLITNEGEKMLAVATYGRGVFTIRR